ncbi:MAG: helix-turn-helix domain-containing protein [Bacteroidales bacterium]|nr:helix-turn-helix domain-containing protein [Bacteroidales bacterium]
MDKNTENKIQKYYFLGLNATEIAKLVDLQPRTVQRFVKSAILDTNKEPPKARKTRVLEYIAKGYSYAEIAKKFKICKTTVYLWHKQAKENNKQTEN